MVSLPPVGGLITIRDKSNESGVVRELQELDGLMTGGAAVYREKSRGERTQPWGEPVLMSCELKMCFPSFTCCFLSDRKSVIHLQVVRHTQLGELLLKQSQDDCVEGRAEIQKQDPGVGTCGIQVLEDVVKDQVDCIVYRPVGSVGKL